MAATGGRPLGASSPSIIPRPWREGGGGGPPVNDAAAVPRGDTVDSGTAFNGEATVTGLVPEGLAIELALVERAEGGPRSEGTGGSLNRPSRSLRLRWTGALCPKGGPRVPVPGSVTSGRKLGMAGVEAAIGGGLRGPPTIGGGGRGRGPEGKRLEVSPSTGGRGRGIE